MSLTQLLPVAGAAMAPLIEQFTEGLSHGLSFKRLFHEVSHTEGERASASVEPAKRLAASTSATGSGHLRRFGEDELRQFLDRLRPQLASAGVDTSIPLDVKLSADGEIVVDGNHPQRAEIETVLRSDPELVGRFRRVAAAFSADWRRENPQELKTREFRLRLNGGLPEVRFE